MNEGKPGPPGEGPTAPAEGPDGDFELARPGRAPAGAGSGHEGDYELDRPLRAGTAPADLSDVPSRESGAPDASAASAAPAVPAPTAAEAEQPRPLHDPDPYGTPPYGEPGPWAPAPPVQHPAATPAHGTAITAPPPAPAPAAPSVPAPAPGTPSVPAQAHPDAPAPSGRADVLPASPYAQAPAPDPWRRYDPWAVAAAAPLQQTGAPVPHEERRRGRTRRALLGAVLVFGLVCGGVGGIVGAYLERNGGIGAVELPQAGRESSQREPGSVAGIAAQALPSVVTLHVSGSGEGGTGTGFVLDTRGHILTNDHVVEPAGDDGEITVTFHSGDTAEATVVGRDSGYDLAVVKVKGVRGLTPLPLGNSDNVRVGDPVVAIGAPFDLAGTVTSGIISAKERPITAGGEKGDGSDVSYVDALQTDAPINPGNSGGPLLDSRARVIGINSAIRSADGGADPEGGQSGSIGLGFAIPINQGKRVAEELINTGGAAHPVIGITLDMAYGGDGARVGTKGSDGGPPVSTGGPGDKAGIKAGDVITEVDGQRIHSGEELIVKTRAHRPGDRLELTLERDGEERKVSLVLGSSEGD
ncbi:trypsin-like peptidase domain-containing protein [Streptomyces prasinosporus]|uniref:Trypsin-like peptidase domain-containing protein n=1 Tax=Streptomyces prasinosporus TaxID=68256 RepID=A0ABP6U6D5_9ACTN